MCSTWCCSSGTWNGIVATVQRAALGVVRVDVLGLADAADFVDGIEQRARKSDAAAARAGFVQQPSTPHAMPTHQPPLRPLAPKPTRSASNTPMRKPGSRCFR